MPLFPKIFRWIAGIKFFDYLIDQLSPLIFKCLYYTYSSSSFFPLLKPYNLYQKDFSIPFPQQLYPIYIPPFNLIKPQPHSSLTYNFTVPTCAWKQDKNLVQALVALLTESSVFKIQHTISLLCISILITFIL